MNVYTANLRCSTAKLTLIQKNSCKSTTTFKVVEMSILDESDYNFVCDSIKQL